MLAHWVLGHSRLMQGQLVAAHEQLGQTLALHDPVASRPLGLLFPGEPGVIGHVELGYALWLLGYPDQGRSSLQQALVLAQGIDQPRTTAFTHVLAGALYSVGRNETEALKHAQALQALGEVGQIYLAWIELLTGQAGAAAPRSEHDQGFAQAHAAESAVQHIGSGAGHVVQLLFQAQTLLQAGQAAMALEAVDQALAWIEHTGVQLLEAEVSRMRGELLLMVDGGPRTMDDGEAAFAGRRGLLPPGAGGGPGAAGALVGTAGSGKRGAVMAVGGSLRRGPRAAGRHLWLVH